MLFRPEARYGPMRPDPARPGPARPGPLRPGAPRYGWCCFRSGGGSPRTLSSSRLLCLRLGSRASGPRHRLPPPAPLHPMATPHGDPPWPPTPPWPPMATSSPESRIAPSGNGVRISGTRPPGHGSGRSPPLADAWAAGRTERPFGRRRATAWATVGDRLDGRSGGSDMDAEDRNRVLVLRVEIGLWACEHIREACASGEPATSSRITESTPPTTPRLGSARLGSAWPHFRP